NFTVNSNAGSYARDRFRLVFNVEAPVPVSFTNVSATVQESNSVSVSWNVAAENAIQYYVVEHSSNGSSFIQTGTVAATANNGGSASYSFADASALTGDNFYRIKSIGVNGEVKYSGIVKVSIGNI